MTIQNTFKQARAKALPIGTRVHHSHFGDGVLCETFWGDDLLWYRVQLGLYTWVETPSREWEEVDPS